MFSWVYDHPWRRGYFLLFAVFAHVALAEQHTEANQAQAADDALSKALLQQIFQESAKQQEDEHALRKELREKYPDVVPQVETYPSLGFYNQIFERDLANTIFFATGSSYLSDVQQEKLDNIADAMNETLSLTLVVEGHSTFNMQIDEPEDRLLYNRWISGRRAVQVWNYLTERHNIESNRIAMYAYDSQRPLNGGDTERERAQNRRVELRLTNSPIPLLNPNR